MLSLLLGVVGLGLLSRARGPDAEQRAALAVLEHSQPGAGENAFAAFWLMAYDVPADARPALVAEDAERILAMRPAFAKDGTLDAAQFEYAAEGRYAGIVPPEADWRKFCKSRESGCLEKVRADPIGYERLLAAHARLIAQASDLRRYGHMRTQVPLRPDMPLPPFQYALAPMTRNAADFVAGRVDTALADVCENAAAWRRIGADSDMLIARMIGIAYVGGYARLFAEMLAELPAERPLPPVCAVAFAPPAPEDGSSCLAMKGESAFIRAGMAMALDVQREEVGLADLYLPLVYSQKMTEARVAPEHAYACSLPVRESLASDVPVSPYTGKASSFDCIANLFGCALSEVSASDGFVEYIRRGQDHSARLRLTATLIWLRERGAEGQKVGEALRQRPSVLAHGRDIVVGEDGRSLRIALYHQGQGDHWELPLPAPAR
ncbi:MAG TPA: hypothetical protein VJ806_06360 [Luteimonas sp.]|nr:hypothetical protein [Luteimonas sp.]